MISPSNETHQVLMELNVELPNIWNL